jgi:hypothetical protein
MGSFAHEETERRQLVTVYDNGTPHLLTRKPFRIVTPLHRSERFIRYRGRTLVLDGENTARTEAQR